MVFWLIVVSDDVWVTEPLAPKPPMLKPALPPISRPLTLVLPFVISVLPADPDRFSLPSLTAS